MKILYYTHRFGFPTETFIYNEIESLSTVSDVLVVANQRFEKAKFPIDRLALVPHYEHSYLGNLKAWWNKAGWFNIRSFKRVWSTAIDGFSPDVIIIPFGTIASRVLEYHDWSLNIPILIIFHGYDASSMLLDQSYVRRLKELSSKKEVFAAFVSEDMRRRVGTVGIQFKKDFVLYCGINVERFNRTKYEKTLPYTFLQVSSLAEKKGHIYTFKAYARLLEDFPDLRQTSQLKIGGGGDNLELYQKKVEELGIAKNVYFLDWVSVVENITLMNDASCFIHHSVTDQKGNKEGIPTVIMEAMAMELPILSTYHSGIPELVEEGVHGYLVEEKKVEDLATKMREIMTWDYKKENREKVIRLFESKVHLESLIQIVKSITSPK